MARHTTGHRVLAVMDVADFDPDRAVKVLDLDEVDGAWLTERSGAATPDDCLEAIRAWKARHGCLPAEDEWAAPSPEHPAARSVVRYFGSWKGALAAAGYPTEPGHRAL